MHFYVDETGQTGRNLFDKTQPILSYGVLSSEADLDKVAEADLAALRKTLGVERLHAAETGRAPPFRSCGYAAGPAEKSPDTV